MNGKLSCQQQRCAIVNVSSCIIYNIDSAPTVGFFGFVCLFVYQKIYELFWFSLSLSFCVCVRKFCFVSSTFLHTGASCFRLVWIFLDFTFQKTWKLKLDILTLKKTFVHCRCQVGRMLYWLVVSRWAQVRYFRTGWRDGWVQSQLLLPSCLSYLLCTAQVSCLPCPLLCHCASHSPCSPGQFIISPANYHTSVTIHAQARLQELCLLSYLHYLPCQSRSFVSPASCHTSITSCV